MLTSNTILHPYLVVGGVNKLVIMFSSKGVILYTSNLDYRDTYLFRVVYQCLVHLHLHHQDSNYVAFTIVISGGMISNLCLV